MVQCPITKMPAKCEQNSSLIADIEGQLEIVKFLLDQLWNCGHVTGQMGSVWSMDIYYE